MSGRDELERRARDRGAIAPEPSPEERERRKREAIRARARREGDFTAWLAAGKASGGPDSPVERDGGGPGPDGGQTRSEPAEAISAPLEAISGDPEPVSCPESDASDPRRGRDTPDSAGAAPEGYEWTPDGKALRRVDAFDPPEPPDKRHVLVVERGALTLNRQPGLLALSGATLEAVEVDGEPFATGSAGIDPRRARVAEPQGDLFPGPRTLDGHATAGALVDVVGEWHYGRETGQPGAVGPPRWLDGRSPIRADLLRVGAVAFALTGAVALTDAEGALLIGGRDSPANRRRFVRAVEMLRLLGVALDSDPTWPRASLVDAEVGPRGGPHRIGPPRWWIDAMKARRERRELTGKARRLHKLPPGPPVGWRLSGGLFRPATKWGSLERAIGGIEAALSWSTSAGSGRRGRLPDNLRPVRRGGPGPEVFIPWWQVFRLAGDVVNPDTAAGNAALRQRWRRLVAALRAGGYRTARAGTAPAGDTVEVVEVRKGGRHHTAGVVVRASARFCAAVASGWDGRVSLPVTRLLPPG